MGRIRKVGVDPDQEVVGEEREDWAAFFFFGHGHAGERKTERVENY